MSKRDPRQKMNPSDARHMGVDRDGSLWVDGNAKGIRTATATEAFREGWDRVFGRKVRRQITEA